jgi:peptidyl-tRNA hydrolase, PTH1 family
MMLLVGLGNPGAQYAGNRHNIGFMALDALARRYRFSPWRAKFQGEVCEGEINGERVLALKPMTYMNESGRSVGEAARFYKIAPKDIFTFYDELDLPPAKLRVKLGGGAAGHNGIRSMIAHLDGDFHRVRLGIGHPGDKARVTGWVLGDFAKVDQEWLDLLFGAIGDQMPKLLSGHAEAFQSAVALVMSPPKVREALTTRPPKPEKAAEGPPGDATPAVPVPKLEPAPANAMADTLRRLMTANPTKPGRKGPK